MGATNNMTNTRVPLDDLFFQYGLQGIGVASVLLLVVSFLLAPAESEGVQSVATIGMCTYVGCLLVKIEHYKEKTSKSEV
jgi:hypothetical protein